MGRVRRTSTLLSTLYVRTVQYVCTVQYEYYMGSRGAKCGKLFVLLWLASLKVRGCFPGINAERRTVPVVCTNFEKDVSWELILVNRKTQLF